MAKPTSAYARTKAKFDALREDASLYFENNKDLVAASEFEAAMALGCFDKEFMYFATAYQDEKGIAYRVSAKEMALQQFVTQAAAENLYPTPVKCFIKRQPCPSGQESTIRRQVKIQAAKALRETYPAAYFEALSALSMVEAANSAYPLLQSYQAELEGVYDVGQLDLFCGLLLTALESKVLSAQSYSAFAAWLEEVYKQLADDIVAKGLYKKVLSAFAYTPDKKAWQYFYDAKPEVVYREKAVKESQGYWVTPIFSRQIWLRDMSQFRQVREQFRTDFCHLCADGYLAHFLAIKNLPGVIASADFEWQAAQVRAQCPPEAAMTFAAYRKRWNVKPLS